MKERHDTDPKRFAQWIRLKEDIHNKDRLVLYSEGEVWWCVCGENVGAEINGKQELFLRPFLIYKKYNKYFFMGIPLTSRTKKGPWCVSFSFRGRESVALLSQARSVSAARLHWRMGQIDEKDFALIKESFIKYFS